MAGEGREAHLDRLPVADVGEHLVEDGQRRRLGGGPQPRLVQERGEPERLQRDRLAAGVGAADHERPQATEVEIDRHGRSASSSGWRAPASRTSSDDLDPGAFPAARERAERDRQVDPPRRLDRSAEERSGLADAGPTARAGSARPPRARHSSPRTGGSRARRRRTARRTTSVRSRRRRGRSPARCGGALAFTASTGRPPRRVMNSSCRCSRSSLERTSCSSLSRTRCRPVRSSPRSLRSFGEALSRRSEPSSSTARSIAFATRAESRIDRSGQRAEQRRRHLVERSARPQRPGGRARDVPECLRRERAAERRVRRRLAHVADPLERRLERLVEEADRLGGQCLPARDLVGFGRGLELGCECGAGRSPSRARPAPGSRETPARRARSGPSDRV